jgi:hypothetical protein
MYICKCGREFETPNSLNAHYSHCLIYREGKDPINRFKGKENWNKGLSKKLDKRVSQNGKSLSDNFKSGKTIPGFLGKHHDKETKENLSLKQSLHPSGGICKWIEYKKKDGSVIHLQGTWEVKFAEYLDSNNVEWVKPGCGKLIYSFFWIDDLGIRRTYTPDFYVFDWKKYFEIKGYWREKDKIKMKKVLEQNKINLQIIEKKGMKELNLI